MRITTTILLIILTIFSVKSQFIPNKIEVVQYEFEENRYGKTRYIKSDTIVLTNKNKILKLFNELEKYDTKESLLKRFEIDTTFIKKNPDYVLSLYKRKTNWNSKQKAFILKKLNNSTLLREALERHLKAYKKPSIFKRIKKLFHRSTPKKLRYICPASNAYFSYCNYTILVYNNNKIINTFKTRLLSKGSNQYYFPYKDSLNRLVYNYEVDKQLNKYFKLPLYVKPLKGNNLLKVLVNNIITNIQFSYSFSRMGKPVEFEEVKK